MDAVPTLAKEFAEYEEARLQGASANVRQFVEEAFYAGAISTLNAVRLISHTADNPAMGMVAMDRLCAEAGSYTIHRVLQGIAHEAGIDDVQVFQVRITVPPKD